MLCTFIKVLDKVCSTFVYFSLHEWKLAKFSWYLTIFQSILQYLTAIFGTHTEFNQILQKLMIFHKTKEISQNFLILYFAFVQFWCTLLTFTFPISAFKSWPHNFGFVQTDLKILKFQTWRLWQKLKSQYRSYLMAGLVQCCPPRDFFQTQTPG